MFENVSTLHKVKKNIIVDLFFSWMILQEGYQKKENPFTGHCTGQPCLWLFEKVSGTGSVKGKEYLNSSLIEDNLFHFTTYGDQSVDYI